MKYLYILYTIYYTYYIQYIICIYISHSNVNETKMRYLCILYKIYLYILYTEVIEKAKTFN